MTLMKSMLLGSAAGIVAVASAQAADLPTRKAAPVEYVKVCNVAGITGWVLPGSDTCMKISGYVTGQFVGGALNTQYNWGTIGQAYLARYGVLLPQDGGPIPPAGTVRSRVARAAGLDPRQTQRVLIAASAAQQNTQFYRSDTGWSVRGEIDVDVASNTAYGPLLGHIAVRGDVANGLDPLQYGDNSNLFYVDQAYSTWAGITAGKAASFFSFIGGGDNWANLFSPDRKGFNEPLLMAYTASFGGGFSATISAESPWGVGNSGGGTDLNGGWFNTNSGPNPGQFGHPTIQFGGQKWPDIVGALHIKQGWGEAQVSGVVHNVNVAAVGYDGTPAGLSCGLSGLLACQSEETKTGWAIDAGLKYLLPSFGAGDSVVITGAYSQSAMWYSGLPDGMWTDNGATNGNGQPMYLADAFFNPATNQWSSPTAWSVTGILEHHFTPQFYVDVEGSIGGLHWSNMGGGCNFVLPSCLLAQGIQGPMSPSAFAWIAGTDLGWNPVTNLNFDLELMYQSTKQTAPSGFLGTVYNEGSGAASFVPGDWKGNSNGFVGRFRVTRYF